MGKFFRVQQVNLANQPGTFRGLDAGSRTAMQTPQVKSDLARFDRIIRSAEDMARRSLSLGERGQWSSHPDVSNRFGNLVDEYAKRIFVTSPDGAALRLGGWEYTPRGIYGGDFINPTQALVVDPCGLSESSVRAHRKYLLNGNRVVVRPSGPTGGATTVNSGGGWRGGLAQLAGVAIEAFKGRERIAEDAGLGVAFLPTHEFFEGGPPGTDSAIRHSIVDKRLFGSMLQRMPVGSELPLEYPVDSTSSWISDVSSQERIRRLSSNPNESLIWEKQPDGWHMARSDHSLSKPLIAPTPTPMVGAGGLSGPMPWDAPMSWSPGHGPEQSMHFPEPPSPLRIRPTTPMGGAGGLSGPMPWDAPMSWSPGHGPEQSMHFPEPPSPLRIRPTTPMVGAGGLSGPMPWDAPMSWSTGHGPEQSMHFPEPPSPLRIRPTTPMVGAGGLSGPMPWDAPMSWSTGHGPEQSTY